MLSLFKLLNFRSFHVSGDNFADNSELVCHFEIFKIRGVASKQLVQDAIFSRPAQFISFQQVRLSILAEDKTEKNLSSGDL